jgi:hypothetical protein
MLQITITTQKEVEQAASIQIVHKLPHLIQRKLIIILLPIVDTKTMLNW